MKSPDYKNGYNDCCEKIIIELNDFLEGHNFGINTSIADVLRGLRQKILDQSYSRFEDDKE